MKATSGRTCVILALLSFSLAAAVSVGVNARHNGLTVQAHTASMQLQGSPDVDEGSVAPADEGDKAVRCTQRDCMSEKVELALARAENPQPHEGKAFAALGEEIRPKSED
jgi:hypothetical protein